MTPLRDLLARCAVATGTDNPDLARDLCRIFIHRDDYPTIGTLIADSLTGPERWQLGSAVALVEHMFPGSTLGMHLRPDDCSATLREVPRGRLSDAWVEERCDRHLALAIVTAGVRAMIAGEEKGRG